MSDSFAVIYSDSAFDDLRNIYAYIAIKKQAPENAKAQVNRIRKKIHSLNFMPEKYVLIDWEPWKSRNTHKVPVDNYVIFYTIDDQQKTVTVIRIFYGGQNIEDIMNSDKLN